MSFRNIFFSFPGICQIWSTVVLDLINALGPKDLEKDVNTFMKSYTQPPLQNYQKLLVLT